MIFNKINFSKDMGIFLIRLNVGILMLMHGLHKIKFGIDDIKQWIVEMGGQDFLAYGVFIPEVIAPICLILGIFVRFSSLLLALNMLVAIGYLYTKGYAPFTIDNYGGFKAEIDILYLLSFCALICLGSGKFTLQTRFSKIN